MAFNRERFREITSCVTDYEEVAPKVLALIVQLYGTVERHHALETLDSDYMCITCLDTFPGLFERLYLCHRKRMESQHIDITSEWS